MKNRGPMQDDLLRAKLDDQARLCMKRGVPCFASFLDEREAVLARTMCAREEGAFCAFFGGYEGAARTVPGFFPHKENVDEDLFPVCALTLRFRPQDPLSHRDFLGSLMGLGLRRDAIGDILTEEGRAVIFLLPEAARFVAQNLEKVGRAGVRVTEGVDGGLPCAQKFQTVERTVASARLDAVLSALTGESRKDSARQIAQGLVAVNHLPCETVTRQIAAGDVLSVRGRGRFTVDSIGEPTKKGRLRMTVRKYL